MFGLIDAEKANYTITKMTALLAVSRSGYYKWAAAQRAPASPGAVRRAGLDAKVAAFHAASDAVYGSPRILADLRQDGETVSRKTVAASMRRQRLQGISPRRFTPVTTIADNGRAHPADLVNRTWDTGRLDGCGHRISLICRPGRAGCICARSVTGVPGGSSAGPWPTTCAPNWSPQQSTWR